MNKSFIYFILFPFLFFGCESIFIEPEPENSAKNNFDILWKTLDENYPMFTVKHINWDSIYLYYSTQISENTSESKLWEIASEMVLNLDDGHVNIFNKGCTKSLSASKLMHTKNADDFSLNLVKLKYLVDPKIAGAGYITYGHLKSTNIGYIHISSFAASGSNYEIRWAYAIDNVIKELYNCEAMIVDLRNNGGGLIVTENIIASAFIDHKVTYLFSQRKTGNKHDDFGEKLPVSISPREGIVPYTKKIIVLTNRFTASGGEYVTQFFKTLPNTFHIGDTTFGAFGEVTNIAKLPNGWTFRYPCTLTFTPDNKCPEGIGLIPDILVKNTKYDIDNMNDKVIEFSMKYLLEN